MKKTVIFVLLLAFVLIGVVFAEKPVATIYKIKGGITVDGKIDDWKALGIEPTVTLNKKENVAIGKPYWLGPEKQSAKVYVAVTEDKLYVLADVKAPKGLANKHLGREIYQGNCIEVFLGFDNSQPDRERYAETDYQIGISVGQYSKSEGKWKVKPSAYGFNLEKPITAAVIKAVEKPGGYIVEAEIPGSFFSGWDVSDGLEIGFDIGVDDVGDKGLVRKIQMTWTGDADGWKNPKGWGKAIIKSK
ncbi:MAG: hypothetical protein N3E50_09660 [Candidatus Goldbacteria bacterium]|nr:hypothetical protein [Candidatus Goldiibacteriota bacterium]